MQVAMLVKVVRDLERARVFRKASVKLVRFSLIIKEPGSKGMIYTVAYVWFILIGTCKHVGT